MSNTVITNYTDLNGPSTKADSSVVVIVNKDGSLSVDQNLLGTLMGSDGSQAAISVVRVGHEGKPDDATDSESDDDKVPHVTLSVDSYYNEPNSIIKYDSGAEMLQSLRIETRENSLLGFQNDHCYTLLTSSDQGATPRSDRYAGYDDPVIEITHTPPPKPNPNPKKSKITILDQQIIPRGKKLLVNSPLSAVVLKGNDALNKPLPALPKSRQVSNLDKQSEESSESSSISSSGDSIPDRDSDSDYQDVKDKSGSIRRTKLKPRILQKSTKSRLDPKVAVRLKAGKNILRRDIKEKNLVKHVVEKRQQDLPKESILRSDVAGVSEPDKTPKQIPKQIKKDRKTPSHVTALLSDMTALFSAPDVIRRISTDGKTPAKNEVQQGAKHLETVTKSGRVVRQKYINPTDKVVKGYDPIPQLDDASLAQILQDTTGITKVNPSVTAVNTMISPGLAGPLSPTLDLLGGLQPEEEGLTEDLLMHVAQLVESSDNLKEVIDKQVLGKVDVSPKEGPVQSSFQQVPSGSLYTPTKTVKNVIPRKDPIEIVRRDGRVITLPPIEAPATRASKRKSQVDSSIIPAEATPTPAAVATLQMVEPPLTVTPEPQVQHVSKQYINKKIINKNLTEITGDEKATGESQESWNSEDDPYRLWCICKQPHNNRFMICCDGCEDWFHGKCVNITKAMGQQMEEQGIEWRCPNCIKKAKAKSMSKAAPPQKKLSTGSIEEALFSMQSPTKESPSKTSCIVCKKAARASSIYCSDGCILKHAQDSLGTQMSTAKGEEIGKPLEPKGDSRVIVYERKSGRLLAGPNAPTAENLKTWLQKHPTFEVVRPGTLSTIKPSSKKKSLNEPNRLQTTLNFEKIPRRSSNLPTISRTPEPREKMIKLIPAVREESKMTQPKTPVTPKTPQYPDMARPSTSSAKIMSEPRKRVVNRTQSANEKAPSVSPSTSRRKDPPSETKKMYSTEPIRENVKKVLQEQISSRMAETKGKKFTEDEIKQFAIDIETELYELFRDVGMKYKAKYRSLMFNIKDRKNLSLWQKICERSITPKQLVRFSPEELASQELAEWRDQESKHQLELIKKSELDLLAASKTYVLKTHKGEEVMETSTAVSTELDPNEVPVEDVVTALNDEAADEQIESKEITRTTDDKEKERRSSRRKDKFESSSKKSSRESKRDTDSRKSRSSRRQSEMAEREERSRRSDKKSKGRSSSKDRSKVDTKDSKDSRRRSRSRASRRRSKSREHSRSTSQTRDGSRSRTRSKRRSDSQEKSSKRRQSTRNKHSSSTEEKVIQRSRSQEASQSKSKHDSTDSDSVERPKSAMQKEVHPEYDPHEPMITSAFSDEDLRKSKDDVFDESFNKDLGEFGPYDPSKSFSIDTSLTMEKNIPDRASGAESDQEPSSTVDNSAATLWNGCINMVDVARFYVAAHEVSGSCSELEEDLNTELDIVGRINPDTVWDYINKMKKTSNKDIVILRMQAANDEEKMQYIALYSYLSSRNRLGVVKVTNTANVKDIYIVPLPASTPLPSVLLPLEGPGIGENKMHLLIAIIIRQRKKRVGSLIPQDIIPAKVVRASRKRSYTPPVPSKGSYTPPSSPRRRALPLPSYTSPALSTSVKDKIAASLAAADEDEAYSPGSSSSGSSVPAATPAGLPVPPAKNVLRTKMEELNRQIEEQKQQILKMAQADSSIGEDDEAYSPSRPMTPPSVNPLADIALPSNLQEILATIKQRSENTNTSDVDMRNLPLPQ